MILRPIRPSTAEWAAFETALRDAGLPTVDLAGAAQHFFAFGSAEAFGGYFLAGNDALLRSIIVPPESRKRGLGRAIVTAILRRLEGQAVENVWLLTTTASSFFEQLGFNPAERSRAPAAISATPQFQGVCPSSAIFMCRPLAAGPPDQEASP